LLKTYMPYAVIGLIIILFFWYIFFGW
jgi:hypothetical protein